MYAYPYRNIDISNSQKTGVPRTSIKTRFTKGILYQVFDAYSYLLRSSCFTGYNVTAAKGAGHESFLWVTTTPRATARRVYEYMNKSVKQVLLFIASGVSLDIAVIRRRDVLRDAYRRVVDTHRLLLLLSLSVPIKLIPGI